VSDAEPRPLLRIVAGGEPTDEEVAALVAAFAVVGARRPTGDAAGRSRWAARDRALRRPLVRGPGAWRASARLH
jgi:hypothetical protein